MDDIFKFLAALQEAVHKGEQEFTCPNCGSLVSWARASGNGHVHCSCEGCGMRVAE